MNAMAKPYKLRSFIQVNAVGRIRGKPSVVTTRTSSRPVVRFYLETRTRPMLPVQKTQILPVKCPGDLAKLARCLRDDEYVSVSGYLITSETRSDWKGGKNVTCVLLCNQIIRMFYSADEDGPGGNDGGEAAELLPKQEITA